MKPKFLRLVPQTKTPSAFSTAECDGGGACSQPIQILQRGSDFDAASLVALGEKTLRQGKQIFQYPLGEREYRLFQNPQTRAALNAPAREIFDFFSNPRKPAEWARPGDIDYEDAQITIARFYEAGFLQDASAASDAPEFDSSPAPLEAWLYLTRACNLACAHCFVSKDVRRMNLETGWRAVERLFDLAERHGHPAVKIKYAGGEPTMNWDLIPALHERAKSKAQTTGLGLVETLVTNATLLNRKRLGWIKNENLRLSVSLDGFGAGHDRQRPVLNGNPSFERALHAILLALEIGLSPHLTVTITKLNLEEIPALAAFALEHRLMLNLNFYRPHHPGDSLVPDNAELIRVLQNSLQVIEANLPDYNFMEGLIDRSNFGASHQHVCGAGQNYLSVDTDGSVLPCHMLTGYNLSGIPLDTLTSPRFDDFSNPPIDRRNGCNACEWRYWCAGGCPIHTQNIFGQSNVSSPYCNVYKAVYPELIRLQALQLIQADAQLK